MMIGWTTGGKIITTVLCCTVYQRHGEWYACVTYKHFHEINSFGWCHNTVKIHQNTTKHLNLTLTFRSHHEVFIRRSWYSVLPSLDVTISCRIKKAVVGVAQLITALVSVHSSMTSLVHMYSYELRRGQLSVESRLQPLSWCDSWSSHQDSEELSTSLFLWRSRDEIEMTKIRYKCLVVFDEF